MERLKICRIAAWVVLSLFAACSDDNHGESDPDLPPKEEPAQQRFPACRFSLIELSEVITSDAQPVTSTQTYLYDEGRLTASIGKQSVSAGSERFEWADTTTVTYGDHEAVMTESTGTVLTYALDDRGYAIRCIRRDPSGNVRNYAFTYHADPEDVRFLESITETIDGTDYSSITIKHDDPFSLYVVQRVESVEQGYTAAILPSNTIANTSELPCLFFTEIYPLSLHATAIYGKLLGEPFVNLINRITPDSNGWGEETTTYDYTVDNRGIVTACRETIRHKETDGYERSYTRTVNYNIR